MTDEAAIMMEDNLNQVWNERYPNIRLKAIVDRDIHEIERYWHESYIQHNPCFKNCKR